MYRHVATHIFTERFFYFIFYGLNVTCNAAVRRTVDTRLKIILGFVEKKSHTWAQTCAFCIRNCSNLTVRCVCLVNNDSSEYDLLPSDKFPRGV
jgi:hypothetical protein